MWPLDFKLCNLFILPFKVLQFCKEDRMKKYILYSLTVVNIGMFTTPT